MVNEITDIPSLKRIARLAGILDHESAMPPEIMKTNRGRTTANTAWSPMPPKANPQSQRRAAQRPCSRYLSIKRLNVGRA